jgi:hypothetical protein
LRGRLSPAYQVLAHAGLADLDAEFEQIRRECGARPKVDCRGSFYGSVLARLSGPPVGPAGRDELSTSRKAGIPCGARQ